MAIDFPATPSNGQTFTSGSVTYTYDGTKWTAVAAGGGGSLSPGSARQLLQTNAAGTATEWTSDVDVQGTFAVKGTPYPSAGPLSNRNLIINGAMQVAQRGTQTAVQSSYGGPDRFGLLGNTAARVTLSQSTDVPSGEGFTRSYGIDVTTASGSLAAGDYHYLGYKFEGQDLQHLKKGTSNAESVMLSFWVKSPKTGTHILQFYDNDNARHISKSYSVSSADTWQKITLTFEGDTTGALDNDNNYSLQIYWWLAAGTSYTSGTLATAWQAWDPPDAAVGQVNVFDSTNNNFYITGVQLEVGEVATPFEHRSYGEELARCERYFQIMDSFMAAGYGNGVGIGTSLAFRTQMRTSPSLAVTGTLYISDLVTNDYVQSAVTGSIVANNRNERGCRMAAINFTGLTNYRPYAARPGMGGEIQLSAEL